MLIVNNKHKLFYSLSTDRYIYYIYIYKTEKYRRRDKMPWSPIPKFFSVVRKAREEGFEREVPIQELRRLLMLETGVISDAKLSKYIRVMEELKLIKIKNNRVAEILDIWQI